jgi:hypothetical protein
MLTMDMHAVVQWITATPVSRQLQDWATWLSPVCEIAHFLGLSLLIGAAGFLDLRLMGFLKAVPLAAAMEFIPWAAIGLTINLISGLLFIGIDPSLYLTSGTWWAKVFFLCVGVGNILIFEWAGISRRARALPAGADTTTGMKCVGAVSLSAWFLVLFFGRMLPYLGSAY